MTTFEFVCPPAPAHWDKSNDYKLHKRVSEFLSVALEPVGHEYLARAKRHSSGRTIAEEYEMEAALLEANQEDLSTEDDEPESAKLLRSNPSNWKDQDHYAILGLSKKRYQATDEDIKRAYRRKVLLHHPDKKKAKTGKSNDDSFFKCVQKAWEVISDPKKRREWDSCDPEFDESIPSSKAKGDFFTIYSPVFEKESRFSKNPSVRTLGNLESPREQVEQFYEFWFNFDSWRTFERLDEEDPDAGDCREEKRYIDRKNKAQRQKYKKEDIARVNKLVEQAFAMDPRIRKFKEMDKMARDAKKNERLAAQKAAELEAKKAQEEEAAAKAAAEEAEKLKAAAEKKDREALKNANRKEKKAIKRILRDHNNFLPSDASANALANQLTKLDDILNAYETPELEAFRIKLETAVPLGIDNLILVFDEEHLTVQDVLDSKKDAENKAASNTQAEDKKEAIKAPWAPKEVAILIKAVKLYPGGTLDRWTKIAEYVNEHGGEEKETVEAKTKRRRSAKECIAYSKQVQQAAAGDRAKLQASVQKPVSKVEVKDAPTVRLTDSKMSETLDTPTESATSASEKPTTTMAAPSNPNWTTEQQVALEAALRQFPASSFKANPSERWEKIAGVIEGKNKKEVKTRVKELAEFAKTKKK